MDIVRFAITKPVSVIVVVILLVLFGTISLKNMPYQLSPSVTEPEITVTTVWPGATPYEVEREIIEEQEKVLKGVANLLEMESSSQNNRGEITLRFKVGTDVDSALIRTANKLDEVPSYPENVEKPVINASGASTSPVIWMLLKTRDDNPRPIAEYRTFFENEIRQYLERVDGVSDLLVFGGTEREMHVILEPDKMAAYQVTVDELISILVRDNVNISAGDVDISRRNYRLRTTGEFKSPTDIEETIIRSEGDRVVTVGHVARAAFGYADKDAAMMHNGRNGIVCGVKPEPGVNIPEMTDRVQEVVEHLNKNLLPQHNVFIDWVYDQRPYINGAIDLVQRNILFGGLLAVITLLVFLRSFSSTVIVTMAIPISIIGTFIFMDLMDRNLNVVSLAGIAFAVGMLVDSAIVVLENIDRHRRMEKSPFRAAYDGTREVWGAILASTLTTVAVFLPVIFIEQEAGQLFKDIAIAVTFAIILSLFVSVFVIPMLANQFFSFSQRRGGGKKDTASRLFAPLVAAGKVSAGFMMSQVRLATANWMTRLLTVALFTLLAIVTTWLLFPKLEYLPQGNRNLILNIMIAPPGLSYAERQSIGEEIFAMADPYMDRDYEGVAGIKNIFYIGASEMMLFGAISIHEQNATAMEPILWRMVNAFPGIFGFPVQAGIFQTGLGEGRNINVDISGKDLDRIIQAGGAMYGALMQAIPNARIQPIPSLDLLYPEVRYIPRQQRLKAVGMDTRELGVTLDVFMDGRDVSDFKQEGEKKIDLVLKGPAEIATPEDLHRALVVTPRKQVVPLASLTDVERTFGLTQIRHLERERTVTMQLTPPETMPLQEGMETIEAQVIPNLKDSGLLDGLDIRMSGAADKLTQTWEVLRWNFVLAMVITYLLMSALFGNFIYPLVIMFTIPLAAAGGFIGLELVNLFIARQTLDVLTMLGFVILIGVVVNNAILIVHQALNNIRDGGMDHLTAIRESVSTRLRPIYMSACTSVFGMLPLVVVPGPGAELYRGLGSVVLGGLALSTVFTIFVIPALLTFFIGMEGRGKAVQE